MLRTYTCQPLFFAKPGFPSYGTNQHIPCISSQPLILSPEHLHNQAWFAVGTESGIYSGREKKKGGRPHSAMHPQGPQHSAISTKRENAAPPSPSPIPL